MTVAVLKPRPRGLPGKVRWFSERPKRRRKSSPRQIVALRVYEFSRLFGSRYHGGPLPDDDSGRDDIEPVLHHFAVMPQPARRAEHWLQLWAPWLTLAEARGMIAEGIADARSWTADQIAWRYRVTRAEREALGLRTIGAIDYGKAARTRHRREAARARKAASRRAVGAKSRPDYLAKTQAQPWIAEGISRSAWYRRKAGAS